MHIEWGWQAGKDDKRKYLRKCKLQNDNEDAHTEWGWQVCRVLRPSTYHQLPGWNLEAQFIFMLIFWVKN